MDVVAEGSEGNYESVVNFMCDVYIKQHKLILNEICGKEGKFPEMKELVNQFFEVSKRF